MSPKKKFLGSPFIREPNETEVLFEEEKKSKCFETEEYAKINIFYFFCDCSSYIGCWFQEYRIHFFFTHLQEKLNLFLQVDC